MAAPPETIEQLKGQPELRTLLLIGNTMHPTVARPAHDPVGVTDEARRLGYGHDHLVDPRAAKAFLRARHVPLPREPLRPLHLQTMQALRRVVRAYAQQESRRATRLARELYRGRRYRLDDQGRFVPEVGGWDGFLAHLFPRIDAVHALGTKLRLCANPECRVLILDLSPGQRRRWCTMSGCGNRLKVRRYRAKLGRRGETARPGAPRRATTAPRRRARATAS